jgi:hypothetical protein
MDYKIVILNDEEIMKLFHIKLQQLKSIVNIK